ncbi:MAG: Holliday junction branch migration protein RuvA [Lentisphaeria bacterium]|nr:Holliday junction branch migration protein RuvA [Lentisphaeria bacterium]
MIARLRGTLAESSYTNCIVDVGGVGYELSIPLSTFDKLPLPGEAVELQVLTQVREDAITLFGFATPEEKNLFRELVQVSGIGGKLALNILSGMSVANFCDAIAQRDVKALSRISGIGKRTAERMVVELHDKLAGPGSSAFGGADAPKGNLESINDAALALENLGYKREAIRKTLQAITAELPEAEQTTEALIRAALAKLNF